MCALPYDLYAFARYAGGDNAEWAFDSDWVSELVDSRTSS